MCSNKFGFELGEMPFYGDRRNCFGTQDFSQGIEVDRAKVEVIEKLPPPANVKGIQGFLGHAGFYRRFIKDFSKISKPLSNLLFKDTPFVMSKECIQAFNVLKKSLISALVVVAPH
ncbi:uncharacterized protein LOC111240747 [Vigna radiata var. radiata]|uniref:Uncharacterized protein LOC111240747 n=1 Tax=Vigna radiata var. radiata TaxID=3916 RepID=A0A3Q0ELX6_VIGRR|nr:uncharacterized protein LOC111240747 [Vigna radiata var. radiata]